MPYYVYECEHVGRVFGCESGMGLGCDRARCKNCGGRMAIWAGTWGVFTRRPDGHYRLADALMGSSDWKRLRYELQQLDDGGLVLIFVKDRVVSIGEAPLDWWQREKQR